MSASRRRGFAKPTGVVAGLCVAVLALGCLGRSPQVRFYSMNDVPGTPVAGTADLAVGVGPVRVPRYLDGPQIVTRVGASRLEIDQFNRWGGDLQSNLLRALGDGLASRLGTTRIVVYPADSPFPLDYRVTLHIAQFEVQPGSELVLRTRWAIKGSGEAGPWSGESNIRRPLAGRDIDDLVAAHDDAIGTLADQIATHLAGLQN